MNGQNKPIKKARATAPKGITMSMFPETVNPVKRTIHRTKHDKEFVQIGNAAVQTPSLSWAATGLLAYLLSLPPDFEVHMRDLFQRKTDGKDATTTAMRELIAAGYVHKIGERKNTRYIVYEKPRQPKVYHRENLFAVEQQLPPMNGMTGLEMLQIFLHQNHAQTVQPHL
jgi:hypothetical protein